MTHTVNFRETVDKQLVEETLALIKDLTITKNRKRIGEKKESLLVINKEYPCFHRDRDKMVTAKFCNTHWN